MKYKKILVGFIIANIFAVFTRSAASEGGSPIPAKKSGASAFFSDVHRECLKNAVGVHPQMIDCIGEETERLVSVGQTILKSATKAPITSDIARAVDDQQQVWSTYVEAKCSLYKTLGGQRGELLSGNCELQEAAARLGYIEDLLSEDNTPLMINFSSSRNSEAGLDSSGLVDLALESQDSIPDDQSLPE
jgi:hypothetical protein